MTTFQTLDQLDVNGKTVLVRTDLNVPIVHGKVSDATRVRRIIPTLTDLLERGAKVVTLSHFGRPRGEFKPAMSLAPLADTLSSFLGGKEVHFAVDCIGPLAREAVENLAPGEIVLLENLRFHAGEESNDTAFADELASLGDYYINDAFSCSHRTHASVTGLPERLPSAAGRLMQAELEALDNILTHPTSPVAGVVGGSKISTKITLLEALLNRLDALIIGGGMANTFLAAQGYDVANSLCEHDLLDTARAILQQASEKQCEILLPQDVIVAKTLEAGAECQVVPVDAIPAGSMILDMGPLTAAQLSTRLAACRTVLWNGPVGAFETSPFDVGTISLARTVAGLTHAGKIASIAGGGDTVAALTHAGLSESFSYLSTAGGAFLEWLEGKPLPGVAALYEAAARNAA